jgi:hypothetical protein
VDNVLPQGSGAFFVSTGVTTNNPAPSATNYSAATANRVYAIPFFLPFGVTLSTVGIGVAAASTAQSFNMAIYDFNKNLVVDSGVLTTTNGGGTLVSAAINATAKKGWYYFAFAATSTTPTVAALDIQNSGSAAPSAVMTQINFFSANTLSGGNMPAALGVLTSISGLARMPIALWRS